MIIQNKNITITFTSTKDIKKRSKKCKDYYNTQAKFDKKNKIMIEIEKQI